MSAQPTAARIDVASPSRTTAGSADGVLRRSLAAAYFGAGVLGAAAILAIALLMVAQTLLRAAGAPTGAANDIVAWLAAAAAFLTMPHAFKHGDFVRVSMLLERLAPPARRWAELAALALASVCVGYLAWWACAFTWQSWKLHDVAQGLLPMPMWIPQTSFAAGALLLLVAVVDELLIVWRGAVPTYVRLVEERHAQGDFSSDI
jgi:TRAP-type C4-dicarboxylate transport system permease small subunit